MVFHYGAYHGVLQDYAWLTLSPALWFLFLAPTIFVAIDFVWVTGFTKVLNKISLLDM